MAKQKKRVNVRLKPDEHLHAKIGAYQKLMSVKRKEKVKWEDAAYELWEKAIADVPALNESLM